MKKIFISCILLFVTEFGFAQTQQPIDDYCRQLLQKIQLSDPQTNPQLAAQNSLARASAWTKYDKSSALHHKTKLREDNKKLLRNYKTTT